MSTSPSPAWRTCSCTIPEGACANELEDVYGYAGARRARGAPQPDPHAVAKPAAAAHVRLHLRPCHDQRRDAAGEIQEHAAARDHGYEHDHVGGVGRRHAADL